MYKIEKRPSGYILTFSGDINVDEMQRWVNDSVKTLTIETSDSFGVIVDMKDLKPLSIEASNIMKQGQKLYKDKGMKRSAVIVNSPKVQEQFKNIAIQSGIYVSERYIDASTASNASQIAIDWVKDGVDPDE